MKNRFFYILILLAFTTMNISYAVTPKRSKIFCIKLTNTSASNIQYSFQPSDGGQISMISPYKIDDLFGASINLNANENVQVTLSQHEFIQGQTLEVPIQYVVNGYDNPTTIANLELPDLAIKKAGVTIVSNSDPLQFDEIYQHGCTSQ